MNNVRVVHFTEKTLNAEPLCGQYAWMVVYPDWKLVTCKRCKAKAPPLRIGRNGALTR